MSNSAYAISTSAPSALFTLPAMADGRVPPSMLVQTRHGPFYVLANDRLVSLSLMYYGELGQLELDFMLRFIQPGDVVADIGANLGGYTVPFARAVGEQGRVLAFEPQPLVFDYLRANVTLNYLPQVALHPFCVGEKEETLSIPEPDYCKEGNFSGQPFKEDGFWEVATTSNRIEAACHRFDDVFEGTRLNFMKIDVEGMEFEVMQGAAKNIEMYRPVIYFENHRVEKSPAIMRWLMARGYRLWWHTGRFYNPDNFKGVQENVFGLMANINMIALPDDRYLGQIPPSFIAGTDPDFHIREPDGKVLISE